MPCGDLISTSPLPMVRMIRQPPNVGAQRHRTRAGQDDPEWGQGGSPADRAVRDQRQEDHAHRLLRVVGAVCQRDQRRREDLAAAESGLAALLRDAAIEPVDQPGADRTDQQRPLPPTPGPGSVPGTPRRSRSPRVRRPRRSWLRRCRRPGHARSWTEYPAARSSGSRRSRRPDRRRPAASVTR